MKKEPKDFINLFVLFLMKRNPQEAVKIMKSTPMDKETRREFSLFMSKLYQDYNEKMPIEVETYLAAFI